MAETKRAIRPVEALDTASDHMAEMLRRTDELLAEWSRFGAAVRAQVDHEANHIGNAVGEAVETAVRRAAATGIDRAFSEQVGAKLAALSAEITKVETRARAASRAITDQRRTDRVILYALGGAMLIAIGLLVALLLRQAPALVAPEPVPVVAPTPAPAPAPAPEVAPPANIGSAAPSEPEPKPDPKSSKTDSPPKADATPPDPKPPTHKGVKVGPPRVAGRRCSPSHRRRSPDARHTSGVRHRRNQAAEGECRSRAARTTRMPEPSREQRHDERSTKSNRSHDRKRPTNYRRNQNVLREVVMVIVYGAEHRRNRIARFVARDGRRTSEVDVDSDGVVIVTGPEHRRNRIARFVARDGRRTSEVDVDSDGVVIVTGPEHRRNRIARFVGCQRGAEPNGRTTGEVKPPSRRS